MPYIDKQSRNTIINDDGSIDPNVINNAGEMNYAITKLVHNYIERNKGYSGFNDAIGALEGVKLELYRRLVSPYEDIKIKENGDV